MRFTQLTLILATLFSAASAFADLQCANFDLANSAVTNFVVIEKAGVPTKLRYLVDRGYNHGFHSAQDNLIQTSAGRYETAGDGLTKYVFLENSGELHMLTGQSEDDVTHCE